jgi:TPR repeat protein
MISARDLDQTFVGAPKDFRGVLTARVSLRSAAGRVLDTQVLRLQWLDVLPDATPPTPDSRNSQLALLALPAVPEPVPDQQSLLNPEPRPQAEPVAAPPISADQVAALISLGRDLLVQGDVAGARVMLKRAALTGNAQAALEIGMSFDPAFLQQRGVLGITPDVTQAIDWYKKATAAGSVEAFHHLKRLDPTLD